MLAEREGVRYWQNYWTSTAEHSCRTAGASRPTLIISPLALDPVDIALGASLHVGGIRLVRVDVHRQSEIRVHSDEHVAKDQFAVALDAHADHRFVAYAVAQCVRRRHVNVAKRANDAAVHFHAS